MKKPPHGVAVSTHLKERNRVVSQLAQKVTRRLIDRCDQLPWVIIQRQ
jgi:hypothetical protein